MPYNYNITIRLHHTNRIYIKKNNQTIVVVEQQLPPSDSPFIAEELSLFILMTLPPSRCIAAENEKKVRVLTS
jgi:hypothetical protein